VRPEDRSCAPEHQSCSGGAARRHATDELSRSPGRLSRRPDESSRRPGRLAGLTVRRAGRPGQLSLRPSHPDGRPSKLDGRPTGLEGREVGARSPGAARQDGMDAPREGMAERRRPGAARERGLDGVRVRGWCAPRPGVRALVGGIFVSKRRWDVATSEACAGLGRCAGGQAELVDQMRGEFACLGGAEEIGRSARGETFFAPAEARLHHDTLSTSCGLSTVASPVATSLDLSEVEDSGRACAMLFDASAGAAPDERFASLASADQHAASGRRVRHG